jgi:hypothetical protein
MKTIAKLCLVLTSVSAIAKPDVAAQLNEGHQRAVERLTQDLTKAMTLGGLLAQMEPHLDSATAGFLRGKIKGQETSKIQIEQTGDLKFRLQAGKHIVPFEIHAYKFDGRMTVELNHREVTAVLGESPEILWEKLTATLPKNASHWSPFATANADDVSDLVGTAGLIGIPVAAHGATQEMAQSDHCNAYNSYVRFCGYLSATQIQNGAELGNSWASFFNPFCRSDRKILRACLRAQARKIGYVPPRHLASYFDQKPELKVENLDGHTTQ